MTMRTPRAESKSSTVQLPSRSGSREVLSLQLIHEQQLVATSVCHFVTIRWYLPNVDCKASGTVKKVIEINPYLLGTMAGGAGEYILRKWCATRPLNMSV